MSLPSLHPVVRAVTARIAQRSQATRLAYLAQCQQMAQRPPGAQRMGCANVAHATAALPEPDKSRLIRVAVQGTPQRHIGIVSAYNDMLSAHAPLQHFPDVIKDEARRWQASAQVAGGVPAMCDGITQGEPGMELSLFSRDVIAMATAVALSHDVFDAALMLGVCDKIVPGLLIGALHFGHLPVVFVPAGPMGSGLSHAEKARARTQAAQGQADRATLLAAETAAYHGPGTCTFYGTANSNQMLLEAMGLHVPGSAFVHPQDGLREALTREAVRTVLQEAPPIGELVDARSIVNAMVALLATGGSTNHLIHWVAVARAAGLSTDWDDFAELSAVVPLLARLYPNGQADVNAFEAAGGPAWVLRELLDHGLLHADARTLRPGGPRAHAQRPQLGEQGLQWQAPPRATDPEVLRPADAPFAPTGGIRVLQGNLGRSIVKVSAVPTDHWVVQAPVAIFETQAAVLSAFADGDLERRCQAQGGALVVVVRGQGPQANGMPELHKLTPVLAVLQQRGHRVALVTDGRMSGASGQVLAAIHLWPEAAAGGPLTRLREGDVLRFDAQTCRLDALVPEPEWSARGREALSADGHRRLVQGWGRELFAPWRARVGSAESGACTW